MSVDYEYLQGANLDDADAVQLMIDEEYYAYQDGNMRREFVVHGAGQGYTFLQHNARTPRKGIAAVASADDRLVKEDSRLSWYLLCPECPLSREADGHDRMANFHRAVYLID